jgi:hypothetical protein
MKAVDWCDDGTEPTGKEKNVNSKIEHMIYAKRLESIN